MAIITPPVVARNIRKKGTVLEVPDGNRTVFSTSDKFLRSTLEVIINGLIQEPNIDFSEIDNKTFKLNIDPPFTGDRVWVYYYKL